MRPLNSNIIHSRVNIYRQDPSVSGITSEEVPKDSIGTKLNSDRVAIVTGRGEFKARADRDGNYLYQPPNKRFNQVQAFVSAQRTSELFQNYADRKIDWAFEGDTLAVIPHAGDGRNAYYARWNKSIAFYSFKSRQLKKTVHTAQSSDIVSHEAGHAILDGLKPQWGKTFDKETKAMHEAFGDCAAMLLTVSRPENRQDALKETGGDLRQDNCISRISEEFGEAVRKANRNPNDDFPYLRNANNQFEYQPPETLPRDGPRDVLSAESHSFCQIFTRAFYNGLVGIYEQSLAEGLEPDQALATAGEVMGKRLAKGLTMAAPNRARFKDVAQAMLRADSLSGGKYQESLAESFLESKILNQADIGDLAQKLPQGPPKQVLSHLGCSDYQHNRSITDETGRTTHEFLRTEEVSFHDVPGWGQLALDVTGGLNLTYDSDGTLLHIAHLVEDSKSELRGVPGSISGVVEAGDDTLNYRLVPSLVGSKLEPLPVFVD